MSNFKGRAKAVLESDRTSSGILTALVIAVVMVVNALLYTLVQTFGWQITYKDEYDYSLSGATDELFEEAIKQNKKVKISFCMAEDEVKVHSNPGHESEDDFRKMYDDPSTFFSKDLPDMYTMPANYQVK